MATYVLAVPKEAKELAEALLQKEVLSSSNKVKIIQNKNWMFFAFDSRSLLPSKTLDVLLNNGVASVLCMTLLEYSKIPNKLFNGDPTDEANPLVTQTIDVKDCEYVEFLHDGTVLNRKMRFDVFSENVIGTHELLMVSCKPMFKPDEQKFLECTAFCMAVIEHMQEPSNQYQNGAVFKLKRLLAGD